MIVTLRKTIPSNSHNAPYNDELGEHWPEGTQFNLLPERRQKCLHKFFHVPKDKTCFEQIGGEEVIISVYNSQITELFGEVYCSVQQ